MGDLFQLSYSEGDARDYLAPSKDGRIIQFLGGTKIPAGLSWIAQDTSAPDVPLTFIQRFPAGTMCPRNQKSCSGSEENADPAKFLKFTRIKLFLKAKKLQRTWEKK